MRKLIGFAKQFTKENIPEISLAHKTGRQYFLISDDLAKDLADLKKALKTEPYSAGMLLGEMVNGKFRASFPFLDILAKHNPNKAVINRKGETLFLYGNTILEESIILSTVGTGTVIVMNEQNEVLGYGEMKTAREKTIITNEFNRSDFLRRETYKSKFDKKKKVKLKNKN